LPERDYVMFGYAICLPSFVCL